MSVINIQDAFLSEEQCNSIIDYYNKFSHLSERYGKTFPINITSKYSEFKEIFDKVIEECFYLERKPIKFQRCEIVRWPSGSYMVEHYDPPSDVLSCIIYLNDNYEGGETFFPGNFKINPKTGRSLIFSNSKYLHSVERVKHFDRYTLSFWFVET